MKHNDEKRVKKIFSAKYIRNIIIFLVIAVAIVGYLGVKTSPVQNSNGAYWFDGGYHHMSNDQIAQKIEAINAPEEQKISNTISSITTSCGAVNNGFCKQDDGSYADKQLETPARAYVPATPDTKIVTGVCTLCNDGTFSPSCAVGRGACSHHGGVAAYGVEQYRIVPGTPAVEARSAIYTYLTKTYKDSPSYIKSADPSLKEIISYQ